jgi:hypothetical protein
MYLSYNTNFCTTHPKCEHAGTIIKRDHRGRDRMVVGFTGDLHVIYITCHTNVFILLCKLQQNTLIVNIKHVSMQVL